MTNYTPTVHKVFNELDEHGLALGLERLSSEKNKEYKQRLLDVFTNRANSAYLGLINGITRELGLSIVETLKIIPIVDADNNPLLTMPAIIFENTKCYLYSDYANGTLLQTIDRWDKDGIAYTIQDLVNVINATGYFWATILNDFEGQKRSMTIFNQSSIGLVPEEDISGQGGRISLENTNLIEGTVTVSSLNLLRRVNSEGDLSGTGDYYISYSDGTILSTTTPSLDSRISYKYRNDSFIAKSSPVIIHKLQSDDFKTKMFEQITADDGETENGQPTGLGAEIINELLSLFPTSFEV